MKNPLLITLAAGTLSLMFLSTGFSETKSTTPVFNGPPCLANKNLSDVDGDGDGRITREEFQQLRAQRFLDADSDGNGTLNLEELQQMREKRRQARIQRRLQRQLQRMDGNGDGVIDQNEFTTRKTGWFQRLDTDNDGVVTRAEANARPFDRQGWQGRRGWQGKRGNRGCPGWGGGNPGCRGWGYRGM